MEKSLSLVVVAFAVVVIPRFVAPTSVGTDLKWTAHYTDQGKLVERFFDDMGRLLDCNVYGDRKLSENVLKEIPRDNSFLIGSVKFEQFVLNCSRTRSMAKGDRSSRSKRQIQLIYPGTKWCGDGNIASNYSDLGEERETDKCCRTHDHCPKTITPGQTKFGIENTGFITLSHCDCDETFFHCLKATKTEAADSVGDIFFNVLEVSCIEEVFPKICTGFWLSKKCWKSRKGEMVIKDSSYR